MNDAIDIAGEVKELLRRAANALAEFGSPINEIGLAQLISTAFATRSAHNILYDESSSETRFHYHAG